MLHAAVLRSPHPHARIVSIDTSAAAAMPGVKAVVTGADTAQAQMGRVPARPLSARDRQGALRRATKSPRSRRRIPRPRARRWTGSSCSTKCCPPCSRSTQALASGAPLVHDDAAGQRRAPVQLRARRRRRRLQGDRRRGRRHLGVRAPVAHRARDHRLRREMGRRPRDDVVQHADAVSRARPLCGRARPAGEPGARHPDRGRRRLRRQVGRRQRLGRSAPSSPARAAGRSS